MKKRSSKRSFVGILATGIRSWLTWTIVIAIAVVSLGVGTAAARSPLTTGWPAAKAQIDEQQQQALAQARFHPRPKLPAAGLAPVSQPPPQRHAGIVAMRQGPFLSTTFAVRNFWQGPVGSDWVLVYAGATRDSPNGPPTRGALRIYSETADMRLSQIGTFAAAPGTGPLTITAASGNLLQLRTDRGVSLSFNLQTHQYQ